jgi:hypothetical protein
VVKQLWRIAVRIEKSRGGDEIVMRPKSKAKSAPQGFAGNSAFHNHCRCAVLCKRCIVEDVHKVSGFSPETDYASAELTLVFKCFQIAALHVFCLRVRGI